MDLFDFLTLIGGLCLFLFGMHVMGEALERRAGSGLRSLLGKMTKNKTAGFLTGMGVTAVIQSSSATTVMVVGFVNSGLMTLKQAIHVIMGANVGTTVTAWLLSLGGIESSSLLVRLLKPSSFTPLLALVGIILLMFCKSSKKKDSGMALLGFTTLMFGMETMSAAVSGLAEVPAFRDLFLMFRNPLLGVLAGAILTAILQSSSASVGILQALTATGQITYGNAIPIIMGQNIGTCVTAMISSVGANKNAKRAALVHLSFNVIGTIVWLAVFEAVSLILRPVFLDAEASRLGIAIAHSVFNVLCTALLLPATGLLEKLARRLIPDAKRKESVAELDERLLTAPPIALKRCEALTRELAQCAVQSLEDGITALHDYTPELANRIRKAEERTDHLEDILGAYLVKLSGYPMSAADSARAAKLLKLIGDYERIADHGVNLLESAEELREKNLHFSPTAQTEMSVLCSAVLEILQLSFKAYEDSDLQAGARVEPLEQVIDRIRNQMRNSHILRLQQGTCSIEEGFIWSDLLTNLERVADHCSNIAGCVLDNGEMHLHETLGELRTESTVFREDFASFAQKYKLPT